MKLRDKETDATTKKISIKCCRSRLEVKQLINAQLIETRHRTNSPVASIAWAHRNSSLKHNTTNAEDEATAMLPFIEKKVSQSLVYSKPYFDS